MICSALQGPLSSSIRKLEFEDVPPTTLNALTRLQELTFSTNRSGGDHARFLQFLPHLPLRVIDFELLSNEHGLLPQDLIFTGGGSFPDLRTVKLYAELTPELDRFLTTFPEAPQLTSVFFYAGEPESPPEGPLSIDLSPFRNLKSLRHLHVTTEKIGFPHSVCLSGDLSGLPNLRKLTFTASSYATSTLVESMLFNANIPKEEAVESDSDEEDGAYLQNLESGKLVLGKGARFVHV